MLLAKQGVVNNRSGRLSASRCARKPVCIVDTGAFTDPELIQKWLLGPEGWTMPVCICEARPGGKIRYEWKNASKGQGFYLTGEFIELVPNRRTFHVERMFLPDRTPDNRVETTFDPDGADTLMTMRMTLPDAQTRAAMLATGMERGMEMSYVRLEGLLQPAAA